jgi:hypothetical protein
MFLEQLDVPFVSDINLLLLVITVIEPGVPTECKQGEQTTEGIDREKDPVYIRFKLSAQRLG